MNRYVPKEITILNIHKKSPHPRRVGFPTEATEEYFCLEDQQSWPCRTVKVLQGGVEY